MNDITAARHIRIWVLMIARWLVFLVLPWLLMLTPAIATLRVVFVSVAWDLIIAILIIEDHRRFVAWKRASR